MQKRIWTMGMWRTGIAILLQMVALPLAMAFDLSKPETLNYDVHWGFIRMGGAKLEYLPNGNAYTLRTSVKDDSSLIDLVDSWESRGVHTAARPFVPSIYHVKQAENSYRADKSMTFDAKTKQVVYVNHLAAYDKVEPLPLTDARDVLATIYNWRLKGDEEVQRAAQIEAVSLKRPITIKREAGVRTRLKIGKHKIDTWRVIMRTVKDGKASKDTWTVYLRDDASMVPVQIVAATKFGTFYATLDF